MAFDIRLWTRMDFNGIPIYIRGGQPDWFVPNEAGDRILREYRPGDSNNLDLEAHRFLLRLPDGTESSYPGRAEVLRLEHLRELWFHLTNRCNQTCRHCLFASSPSERAEMPAARLRELAAEAAGLGCRVFALTGGEPLFHPEFEAIVDHLLGYADAHVVVLTNATLLKEYAGALARWPAERFHLQISLDGLEKNHDQIRGKGAFARLGDNLDWLKSRQSPYTLSICVTAQNVQDLPRVVDYAAATGAANLHFMWYFVRGRGAASQFVDPRLIFPAMLQAVERAAKAGISIDNLEALRSQIFAPSGTRHDGASSGWESLALGPDGKLYPSPALVGVENLATDLNAGSLQQAWRRSPVLDGLRRSTVRQLSSPWAFLLGGGDPDHSYLYGGEFVGLDPYLPLHEQMALWLVAREASSQSADGPPRLRLKMGDILESCGAHGSVALTHTNCLLATASPDSRTVVQEFYHAAAATTKEDILNPVCYPEETIAHIPAAARVRSYGCGSPVLDAGLRPGETILDLGCGTGVECFIAARLVGAQGQVIGVDMLDAMLDLAGRGAAGVAGNLGYHNLDFRKGYLEELPMTGESVDAVLSNCVINLSSHKRRTFGEIFRVLKPGGRLVISDVVCETEPDPDIKNDDVLRGECIAGALTQRDLVGILEESGFIAIRMLKRFPYRVVKGQQFFSMTYEARRPASGEAIQVMYRGPHQALVTSRGTVLPVGLTRAITWEGIPGDSGDLFIFNQDGVVINLQMEAPACCAAPGEPFAAGADYSCCQVPERQQAPVGPGQAAGLGMPPLPKHQADCLVCGAPLTYLPVETDQRCVYCQKVFPANAVCEQGHFVCDACHTKDGRTLIERVCLATSETDLIALLQEIRSHPAIPLHGPEHHILVPGVILAAYRNLGGEVSPAMLRTALDRGQAVPGGVCAFTGVCGAAAGVGIAFSLLLEANPLKPYARQQVGLITQAVLQELTPLQAARCCQRECWLALRKAAELSREFLPLTLRAEASLICRQADRNRECLGTSCPLVKGA